MSILHNDKLEHIFYCISKDEMKNCYNFLVAPRYNRVLTSTGKETHMTILNHDKLEHIFYCISKDEMKNSYYFLIGNDYYIIKLYTEKIVFDTDMPIKNRDKRMIETLGYWLNDSNLNLDNIYVYIRLKAINNKDFFHWWTRYNFQIEIERKVD